MGLQLLLACSEPGANHNFAKQVPRRKHCIPRHPNYHQQKYSEVFRMLITANVKKALPANVKQTYKRKTNPANPKQTFANVKKTLRCKRKTNVECKRKTNPRAANVKQTLTGFANVTKYICIYMYRRTHACIRTVAG